MWERLHQERQRSEAACLVVTQKRIAMQYADQIIVMDNGQIKMKGTYKELMNGENSEEFSCLLS